MLGIQRQGLHILEDSAFVLILPRDRRLNTCLHAQYKVGNEIK